MKKLQGKVALVTGASRGIGRAIAERLGQLGADVIVNYSSSEAAALECVAAIEASGVRAVAVKADIGKVSDIETLFARAIDVFGRIDVVVANAGIETVGISGTDFTEEQFDRTFGINTKGTYFTLREAARHVNDGGRIIYIGSSTTGFPMPGHAVYGGSKVAPRFLVEVMAKELGRRGVTVNSVLPTVTEGAGVSATEVRPAAREFVERFVPRGRPVKLQEVADAVEFLASDLAGFVSGQHLLLSAGGPA